MRMPLTPHFGRIKTMVDWKEIDGWLSVAEGEKLQELAAGKDVLELGCFKGRSTVCMAAKARSILSMDAFFEMNQRSRETQEVCDEYFDDYLANISGLDNVSYIVGTAPDDIPRDKRFDFIFVDDCHRYSHVAQEIEIVRKIIKPDGVISFHDYAKGCGVPQAVDESGLVILGKVGTTVWCRLPGENENDEN